MLNKTRLSAKKKVRSEDALHIVEKNDTPIAPINAHEVLSLGGVLACTPSIPYQDFAGISLGAYRLIPVRLCK